MGGRTGWSFGTFHHKPLLREYTTQMAFRNRRIAGYHPVEIEFVIYLFLGGFDKIHMPPPTEVLDIKSDLWYGKRRNHDCCNIISMVGKEENKIPGVPLPVVSQRAPDGIRQYPRKVEVVVDNEIFCQSSLA